MSKMNGFRKVVQNERGDGLMLVMVGILLASDLYLLRFLRFLNYVY